MANKYSYLEGVMFYPFIFDQTDKFDRYSVALGLEGDQVKAARNLGLSVKQEDGKMDDMPYVQLKSNYKPTLVDSEENDYKGPTQLSNGSKGVVRLSQRPYNNKYGQGVTTFINAVKITDPIEYVSLDDEPGGFSTPKRTVVDEMSDDVPF
tara:strand:+ start:231 stop:683 length:453 start_codon:yes stop_codon:yes gene_type:complete